MGQSVEPQAAEHKPVRGEGEGAAPREAREGSPGNSSPVGAGPCCRDPVGIMESLGLKDKASFAYMDWR